MRADRPPDAPETPCGVPGQSALTKHRLRSQATARRALDERFAREAFRDAIAIARVRWLEDRVRQLEGAR